MKTKTLALLLAVLLLLTACGSPPAETTAPAQTTVPTTAPVETAAPLATTEPPVELTRYPLNADSTYVKLAQELPDHIYTTTGSENGLAGTVYTFTGTVQEHSTTTSGDFVYEQITMETDRGPVLIMNFYKSTYNQFVLSFGEAYADAQCPYPVADYCFPDDGEAAEILGTYIGYSGVAEMPAFYLGANSCIFEWCEWPDPAESAKSSATCTINGSSVTAGNLIFQIPEGYTATLVNENALMLGSPDGKCGISIFSADISDLDEATAMAFIPMQQESFYSDDAVKSEIETIGPYDVGGFDVELNVYTEMFTDLTIQSVLDTTFTDSWYSYTIQLRATETSTENYATAYGTMVLGAIYAGDPPRFDFVQ